MESLFENSIKILNLSAFLYLLAALLYFTVVSRGKESKKLLSSAKFIALVSFVLHTVGLGIRWYLGGIDRPPWTNLYESLIFFSWGAGALQMIAQYKWRFPLLGAVLMPLVFLLMGMGVMTPNKEVEPLIPALQSHWLKIHVVFGMVAYAGFTVAACVAFLHLVKNSFSFSKIGGTLSLMALLHLFMMGGWEIFQTGHFHMAKSVERQLPSGKTVRVKDVYQEYPDAPKITRKQRVPGADLPFYGAVLSFFLAAFFMFFKRKERVGVVKGEEGNDLLPLSKILFCLGSVFLGALLVWIQLQSKKIETLSFQSNPYLLMLLITTLFFNAFYLVCSFRYDAFLKLLPSAGRLHELAYKNILFSFPFQTLLLISGAIWAYYAWGRSWGWDPKEVGALVTWFVYLIYLHGKLLLNWKENTLSLIAIVGFVVMVFAFLGVNLLLSGFHSYGAA